MTELIKNVAIQFIRGKIEKDLPEIRIFRNIDKKKGHAIYKFYNPRTITKNNFNSIKKMYLIDQEGELSTKKIKLSLSHINIIRAESTYSWDTEKEFERFMRFAERYSHSITN